MKKVMKNENTTHKILECSVMFCYIDITTRVRSVLQQSKKKKRASFLNSHQTRRVFFLLKEKSKKYKKNMLRSLHTPHCRTNANVCETLTTQPFYPTTSSSVRSASHSPPAKSTRARRPSLRRCDTEPMCPWRTPAPHLWKGWITLGRTRT